MIEVKHLYKKYGNHYAVSDLSFNIESGHVYGFLGPNGAGKSTTMNIITGCLAATSGEVYIGGYDIFEEPEKAKKLVGYLPEHPPLYLDMTAEEYLKFVAQAKGVKRNELKRQIEYAVEVTGLTEMFKRQTKNLSKGYRQRVGIAQALLGEPELIILDEPTVGLDPIQIIEIRDLIKSLGKSHTVVLSSHILSEIRSVCSAAIIIAKGKMIANDTLENLENFYAGDNLVTLRAKASEIEIRRTLAPMDAVLGVTCTPMEDGVTEAEIQVDSDFAGKLPEQLFYAFASIDRPILHLSEKQATLEDVFLDLTAKADISEEAVEETTPETEAKEGESK